MSERLALIGFGEAGRHIATGLIKEAKVTVKAFDLRFAGPDGAALKTAAEAAGIQPCDGLREALDGATIVLSLVVGSAAVAAARSAAAFLKPGCFYVDMNSVSPGTKREVGAAVASSGVDYVEAAVMARVPPYGHRVPLLLAGPKATVLAERLGRLGMSVEAVGEAVGQASLNKMLRSIMVKGIEALMLECLLAARRWKIEERILDSVIETFPGLDWRETATYYLGRTAIHGARRVTEMAEAADTVAELGLDPVMSKAIGQRIGWAYDHLRNVAWPGGAPKSYTEVLVALDRALTAAEQKASA
jgi:3-hydroxyisobutyrate dehydrogenase-like beta-hydroxyacid dehydrogenase